MPVTLQMTADADVTDAITAFGSVGTAAGGAGAAFEEAGSKGGGLFSALGGGVGSLVGLLNPVGLLTTGVGLLGPKLLDAGRAAGQEQQEIDQLTNTLNNAVPAWDGNTAAIDAAITAGQAKAFSDSDLRASLGLLATDTGSVEEAIRLQGIAMDLAASKGISLEAATKLIGKADDGSYTALAKLGIEVNKHMTREEALAAIQAKTAGSADLFAASAEGAGVRLQASLGDTMETLGTSIAPLMAGGLDTLANVMVSLGPVIQEVTNGLATALTPALSFIEGITSTVGEAFSNFTDALSTGTDPITAISGLLSGLLVGGLTDLATAFGIPIESIQGLREGIQTAFDTIGGVLTTVVSTASAILGGLGGVFSTTAASVSPLSDVLGTLGTAIGTTAAAFLDIGSNVFAAVSGAVQTSILPALQSLGDFLSTALPPAIATVSGFWTGTLLPAIQAVWGFITATVIPVAGQLVGWLITQIPTALTFLGNAWTTVLAPAISQVWTFVQGTVFPIAQQLLDWLATNLPPAIQGLANFWTQTLQPAVQTVGTFFVNTIFPMLGTLLNWIATQIPPAIQTLANFWTQTLQPALNTVWTFITTNVIPMLSTLFTWFSVTIPPAVTALANLWTTTLQPALKTVWDFLNTNILPMLGTLISTGLTPVQTAIGALTTAWGVLQSALGAIADMWNNTLKPAATAMSSFFGGPLKGAIDGVGNAINTVIGFLSDLASGLANVKLPDWMTPGSPTPWETGLVGVSKALHDLTSSGLPALDSGLRGLPTPGIGVGTTGGGGTAALAGTGPVGGGSAGSGAGTSITIPIYLDGALVSKKTITLNSRGIQERADMQTASYT